MSRIHDDAIVLARYDYSETSQVIMLFTRHHGKIRAIAKGVKRGTKNRFAVGVDLLDLGHVIIASRSGQADALGTVVEWKQTQSLTGLRNKLFRIHAAQYAADVTARLMEDGDPHPELFEGLLGQLQELTSAKEPFCSLFRFQIVLLNATGSWPRFDACVQCGRDEHLSYFSSFEGGMVCETCAPNRKERHRVSPSTFRVCRSPDRDSEENNDLTDPPGKDDSPAYVGPFRLLNYHISHLMGRESVMVSKLLTRVHS